MGSQPDRDIGGGGETVVEPLGAWLRNQARVAARCSGPLICPQRQTRLSLGPFLLFFVGLPILIRGRRRRLLPRSGSRLDIRPGLRRRRRRSLRRRFGARLGLWRRRGPFHGPLRRRSLLWGRCRTIVLAIGRLRGLLVRRPVRGPVRRRSRLLGGGTVRRPIRRSRLLVGRPVRWRSWLLVSRTRRLLRGRIGCRPRVIPLRRRGLGRRDRALRGTSRHLRCRLSRRPGTRSGDRSSAAADSTESARAAVRLPEE